MGRSARPGGSRCRQRSPSLPSSPTRCPCGCAPLGHRSGGTSGAVPRPWELSHQLQALGDRSGGTSGAVPRPWELSQQLQALGHRSGGRRYLRSGAQALGALPTTPSSWAPLRRYLRSGAQTLGALTTTPWELSQQLQPLGTAPEVPPERCPDFGSSHNNSSPWAPLRRYLRSGAQALGALPTTPSSWAPLRRYLRSGAQTLEQLF